MGKYPIEIWGLLIFIYLFASEVSKYLLIRYNLLQIKKSTRKFFFQYNISKEPKKSIIFLAESAIVIVLIIIAVKLSIKFLV